MQRKENGNADARAPDERSDGVRAGGPARRGRKTVLVFGGSGMLGIEIVGRFEADRHAVHVVNPFRTAGDIPSLHGYADKVFEILSRLGMNPVRRFQSVAFGRAAAPDDERRTARRPFSSVLEPPAEETPGARFWAEELACYIQEKFANGIKDVR